MAKVLSNGEKARIKAAKANGGSRYQTDRGAYAYISDVTPDMMNDIGNGQPDVFDSQSGGGE